MMPNIDGYYAYIESRIGRRQEQTRRKVRFDEQLFEDKTKEIINKSGAKTKAKASSAPSGMWIGQVHVNNFDVNSEAGYAGGYPTGGAPT